MGTKDGGNSYSHAEMIGGGHLIFYHKPLRLSVRFRHKSLSQTTSWSKLFCWHSVDHQSEPDVYRSKGEDDRPFLHLGRTWCLLELRAIILANKLADAGSFVNRPRKNNGIGVGFEAVEASQKRFSSDLHQKININPRGKQGFPGAREQRLYN